MDPARIENRVAIETGFVERDDRAWGGPREAWIEVAARCNLHCVMCPLTYDPRYHDGSVPELLTPDRFAALEPIFPTLDRAHLFGLGEPLLSPYLLDYARRLAAADVEVWTTTNGTLIGPTEADALADAGFARVTVSIDGATRETYERIRAGGRFDDVVAGLRALGEVRRRRGAPELHLLMVAMASNLHELPGLVELAAAVGADGVHVASLYAWDHPAMEELARAESLAALGPAAIDAHLAEGRSRARTLGLELTFGVDLAAGANGHAQSHFELPWACSEPWSTINVNARGEIRTCSFNDDVMGTLRDDSNGGGIGAIWNGAPYRELRYNHLRLHAPPSCARCVRAGHVRRSPYLPQIGRRAHAGVAAPAAAPRPILAARATPPPRRELPALLAPANGEPCAGSVIVMGELPRRSWRERLLQALERSPLPGRVRTWAGRRLDPLALPDLYLDGELVARVGDSGVHDRSRWAIVLDVSFVTPGSHRLAVRAPTAAGGALLAERRLQVVATRRAVRGADITAVLGAGMVASPAAHHTFAVCLELEQPEPPPQVTVDGRPRRAAAWICGTYGAAWRGFALLEVADLDAGSHQVELTLTRHPPHRVELQRIAVGPPAHVASAARG